MTKELILSKGYVALVDDEDFERASQFKWSAAIRKGCTTLYASAYLGGGRANRRTELLHRFILSAAKGVQVDHIDGNGLNCTRQNLRLATISQNRRNRGKTVSNKSGFKGVYWHKDKQKFAAQIKLDAKLIHLGKFNSAEEAARAYDVAAKKYHGDFAKTNFT